MPSGHSLPLTRSAAACAAGVLLLSGCAGSAGSSGGGGSADGEGYAHGAEQSEISAALADLDPVTVTYQIPATSLESPQAPMGVEYKEAVEEMSDGKITVELAFNQSIASYDELHDALADGRVDMAFTLPIYEPDRYPAFNALNTLLAELASSPVEGELLANLVAAELGWTTPELLDSYEEAGVVPYTPLSASGAYYSVCADSATELEDWRGLQVRVGSQAQNRLVSDVGGTAVSIAGVEAYEALQRGTIDCTLAVPSDVAQGGFFEVAPTLGYPTETAFPRVAGAVLQGQGVTSLPLAYQQVLFDSFDSGFHGGLATTIGGKYDAIVDANERDVDVEELSSDVQSAIQESNEAAIADVLDSDVLGADIHDRLMASAEHWQGQIEELGYADEGGLADMHEWYDEDTDYRPLGEALFERVLLEHRPA